MARKPHIHPGQQREARQALINAAPLVSDYPGIDEVHVELKFSDPEGKQQPSPRGVSFAPHMRAYFNFSCPMRDCTGGGFDANADLQHAMAKRRNGHSGGLACGGNRPRSGMKNIRCNIELRYIISIRMAKAGAAAA